MSNYKRVISATRCSNGLIRGFRLYTKKLSIHRLIRARFLHIFRFFNKWKKSYNRAVRSLRKGLSNRKSRAKRMINDRDYGSNYQSRLIGEGERKSESRLRSLARTNSFYTEAIADCLEFIKRNSLSLDDHDHDHDEAAPIAVAIR